MYTKPLLLVTFIFSSLIVSAQNVGINTTGAAPAATNMFEVLQTSTTANTVGIYSSHSGAVSGTGYGIYVQNTGASTNNIAALFTASGASTGNLAIRAQATSSGLINYGIDVVASGATTCYGALIGASGTGTTNIGASISASGATNNYALIVGSGKGSVGIGTGTPSDCSILDISSTDKGILIPRVALTNIATYAPLTGTPVDGMMVYNNEPTITDGNGTGYYYWSTASSTWINVADNHTGGGIGYTLQGSVDNLNPSDASSYYFGAFPTVRASLGFQKVRIPRDGRIKYASVFIITGGIGVTAETSSMYIDQIDLSSFYSGSNLISNSITVDMPSQSFENSAMEMNVAQGEFIEIRWDTPTWVTNPTSVYIAYMIFVETK